MRKNAYEIKNKNNKISIHKSKNKNSNIVKRRKKK